MTGYSGAATVETCHMTVSVITQLPGQRVVGGNMLGRLEFRGRLGTGGDRRGYVKGDAALAHWICVATGHGFRFDVVSLWTRRFGGDKWDIDK
jgi:hypothetical protein